MEELLKQWHALLHACLVERGATWKQHDKFAARNYSLPTAGGCFLFDPLESTPSTIKNYLDINTFLTVGNTAPLSVGKRPIIWASVMKIGKMEFIVIINNDYKVYQAVICEIIDFAQTTNPIFVSFVLKQLLK